LATGGPAFAGRDGSRFLSRRDKILIALPDRSRGEAGVKSRMNERFERHRQPWRPEEVQKLHTLAKKGMALKAIAKALRRSEESVKDRAKLDGLPIAKLR
jgi:hypothetical protein